MIQADSVHSTPPTNTSPTRRNILGTIAAAAAATTIAGKPAAADPIVADPIYAAIEAHRKADAAADVAFAESSRLYRLANEMVGPSKIEVPNMVEPGTTAKVLCFYDVEQVIPHELYGWLQVKCRRCETEASIPLEHVSRPRDTPIWKLVDEI